MANELWPKDDIITKFIRECQECGHEQQDTEPSDSVKRDEKRFYAWQIKPCKKCRSEALDYGSNKMFSFKTGKELTYEQVYGDEEV